MKEQKKQSLYEMQKNNPSDSEQNNVEIQEKQSQSQEMMYKPEDVDFKFSFKELIRYFGPGLLVSIAYLDPGNLSGNIDAGVSSRYSLLWVLLLATFLGYLFQIRSMIIGLATKKDMAKLCRMYYPRKVSFFLWLMCEIAIIGADIQEVLGSAFALNILFGISVQAGVLLTIFATFLILLFAQKLETLFAVMIGIMAISFFVEFTVVSPDYLDLFKGIFIPQVNEQSIDPLIGLIGAVLMPHNLFLHSSLIMDKKIEKKDIKRSMFYFKAETALSLGLSFFISVTVIGTFAYWYGSEDIINIDLTNASDFIYQKFGTFAKYIWGIGLLASGSSSTLTGTIAGQYIMSGFIKIKVGKFKRAFVTRAVAIIPSTLIVFVNFQDNFNNYLNILQSIQLPFAVIPLIRFSASKQIMNEFVISKKELVFLSTCSVLIILINFYSSFEDNFYMSSVWNYMVFALMLLYFVFICIVLLVKIEKDEEGQSIIIQ